MTFFFAFFYSFAFANSVQNNIVPSQFKEGHFSFGAELNYLSTSSNYDESGVTSALPSGYSYSTYQSLLYGRYDYNNNLSLFSDLGLNYALSENNIDKRNVFKISGITLGANYDLGRYYFKLIPEVRGYFALEKFEKNMDEVLSSDGMHSLDFGVHALKKIWDFQFHSYLSYQYRMDGFSGLFNYQFDLSYFFESFTFVFGTRGFESLTDDENTDNPLERHLTLTSVNGASLMYASVNPSRTDVFAFVKYPWSDSVDFYGSINKSLRGENSADLLSLNFGFEYFFEPLTKTKSFDYKNYDEDEEFEYEDETIDPKIQEEIKNYNKEKKPKPRKTEKQIKNDLKTSKKEIGKFKNKFKQPSAKKSSKKKRVRIDF